MARHLDPHLDLCAPPFLFTMKVRWIYTVLLALAVCPMANGWPNPVTVAYCKSLGEGLNCTCSYSGTASECGCGKAYPDYSGKDRCCDCNKPCTRSFMDYSTETTTFCDAYPSCWSLWVEECSVACGTGVLLQRRTCKLPGTAYDKVQERDRSSTSCTVGMLILRHVSSCRWFRTLFLSSMEHAGHSTYTHDTMPESYTALVLARRHPPVMDGLVRVVVVLRVYARQGNTHSDQLRGKLW